MSISLVGDAYVEGTPDVGYFLGDQQLGQH